MLRGKRRIAFFGGTFDPFHLGHLAMAQAVQEALQLHQVCFVPTAQNPHKADNPQATGEQRLEMIREGIRGVSGLGVWEGELGREGLSYTWDSVCHLERIYPNSYLFWIIGMDQLASLPGWHAIEDLVRKVGFILVKRPGYTFEWPSVPGLTLYPVKNDLLDISSRDIRSRIQEGLDICHLVPEAVAAYIRQSALYQLP